MRTNTPRLDLEQELFDTPYKRITPDFLAAQASVKRAILDPETINDWDHYGQTPLGWAIIYFPDSICSLLIQLGADVDRRNVWNQPPLAQAWHRGRPAVAQMILDAFRRQA